jgi:hypothetical protein
MTWSPAKSSEQDFAQDKNTQSLPKSYRARPEQRWRQPVP